MYEVFIPSTGNTVMLTKYRTLARIVALWPRFEWGFVTHWDEYDGVTWEERPITPPLHQYLRQTYFIDDWHEAVVELLSDARHLCHGPYDVDFEEAVEDSKSRFLRERRIIDEKKGGDDRSV